MKSIYTFTAALVLTLTTSLAIAATSTSVTLLTSARAHKRQFHLSRHIDLPPDATTEDYMRLNQSMRLLEAAGEIGSTKPVVKPDDGLEGIVAAGERNFKWLAMINDARDKSQKISFTDADHRIGYPIDKANKYSPSIVQDKYAAFVAAAPTEFMDVVTGKTAASSTWPSTLTLDQYKDLGRALDRIYQSATRWRTMQPYLVELAGNADNDVRGYYFLSNMADREQKLTHFSSLAEVEKIQVAGWLTLMCRNGGTPEATCKSVLDTSEKQSGNVLSYYEQYAPAAKSLYDSFFLIPQTGRRSDITWMKDATSETAMISFIDPGTDPLRAFMMNVEDEWHWGNWALKLNFVNNVDPLKVAHLEFQAGATPHVNDLGGNIITMDQNTPLTDWENNWTIRHEFGHVLGFPDCYIEFYDVNEKVMTNYQLDMTNLMCSRKGNLKEVHRSEMTRVYSSTK